MSMRLLRYTLLTALAIAPCLIFSSPTRAELNNSPSRGLQSDRALLAQRVIDGLPPPPALPPADQYSSPVNRPTGETPQYTPLNPVNRPVAPANEAPQYRPINPQNQRPSTPQTQRSSNPPARQPQSYWVVVNGDSPLLLNQVRQIVPGAAIAELDGQRLIQVGTYATSAQAEQQVTALNNQGIQAEVVSATAPEVAAQPAAPEPESGELLPVTPVPSEVTFGQPPELNSPAVARSTPPERTSDPERSSPYYVVIPGSASELSQISAQVKRLGQGLAIAPNVQERTAPIGPHVLVGPFTSRSAAERWNRYLRDFGMSARLYYRR